MDSMQETYGMVNIHDSIPSEDIRKDSPQMVRGIQQARLGGASCQVNEARNVSQNTRTYR